MTDMAFYDVPHKRWDQRWPLAVILALMVQSATALLWIGAAGARLNHLEQQVVATSELAERTARIEARIDAANAALRRIERRLDRPDEMDSSPAEALQP